MIATRSETDAFILAKRRKAGTLPSLIWEPDFTPSVKGT
jgi:hypothetical protein